MLNVHQILISTNSLGICDKYLQQIYSNIAEIFTPIISIKSYEDQKISFLVSQKLTWPSIHKVAKRASMILVATPITYFNHEVRKTYHRLLLNCNSML